MARRMEVNTLRTHKAQELRLRQRHRHELELVRNIIEIREKNVQCTRMDGAVHTQPSNHLLQKVSTREDNRLVFTWRKNLREAVQHGANVLLLLMLRWLSLSPYLYLHLPISICCFWATVYLNNIFLGEETQRSQLLNVLLTLSSMFTIRENARERESPALTTTLSLYIYRYTVYYICLRWLSFK